MFYYFQLQASQGNHAVSGSSIMLKNRLFILVCFIITAASQAAFAQSVTEQFRHFNGASSTTVDHSTWDKLLKTYVKTDKTGLNRVDYKAFKDNGHKTLKAYVKYLERIKVTNLNKAEQFAFWVNLYNAKTIDVVLDHYPVRSIRNISVDDSLIGFLKTSVGAGGPWKAKIITVAGASLSLDDVEHNILRPVFKDPRVHYAVNCASIGCPNLRITAFTADNLEGQLNAGAIDYINSPRGFTVIGENVTASSIYRWFQEDFGGTEQSIIAHALEYAKPKLKTRLARLNAIDSFAYDWALNDTTQ